MTTSTLQPGDVLLIEHRSHASRAQQRARVAAVEVTPDDRQRVTWTATRLLGWTGAAAGTFTTPARSDYGTHVVRVLRPVAA